MQAHEIEYQSECITKGVDKNIIHKSHKLIPHHMAKDSVKISDLIVKNNFPITFITKEKAKLENALAPVGSSFLGRAVTKLVGIVLGKTIIRLREVKNLSDEEIKTFNDIAHNELSAVIEVLEETENALCGNPEVAGILHERKEAYYRGKEQFDAMYLASYGLKPQRLLAATRQTEYSIDELASKYFQYARTKHVEEPSQSELKDHFNISQSTWSRAYKDTEFWDNIVNKSLDVIKEMEKEKQIPIAVYQFASDKVEKIRFDQRKTKELPLKDDSEKSMVLADGVNASTRIEQTIDINRQLSRMSKQRLIEVAQSLAPSLGNEVLEQMDELGLRKLIIALSLST